MSAKLSKQAFNCKGHTIMCQKRTVRVTDTCECAMVGKFLKLHCTQQSMPNNTEGRRRQVVGRHVHRESAFFWLSFSTVAGCNKFLPHHVRSLWMKNPDHRCVLLYLSNSLSMLSCALNDHEGIPCESQWRNVKWGSRSFSNNGVDIFYFRLFDSFCLERAMIGFLCS